LTILSDGQRLFCYHDKAGFKGSHFRRILMSDNEIRRFEDVSMRLDLAGDDVNQGFVIATHPLSEASWHPFQAGELIVFGDGQVQFSSQRETGSAEFRPSSQSLRGEQ
jgi:predicted glutamine amidotransferase